MKKVPIPAHSVGYDELTFDSTFAFSTIDVSKSYAPGFDWYVANFFGFNAPNPITLNSDGTATINGSTGNANLQVASAAISPTGWVGAAFGGGAYFEAVLKFDPSIVNTANGFPSWWSMAIEHLAGLDTVKWDGQTEGYKHFAEIDFFEYDTVQIASHSYGGAFREYWGVYVPVSGFSQSTAPPDFVRVPPRKIRYNDYHAYGLLWVPATDFYPGKASWFFDGVKIGTDVVWNKFSTQAPPPISPWQFGVVDQQHLVLILGSGDKQPMNVKSVRVWQQSDANNLVV